jgi:hypothetical protein
MAVLREVVTRFRLESSEQDFRGLNLRVDGVKNGLRSLAGLFGVTLGIGGAVAIGRMGLAATQTATQLRYMAGTDFSKFEGIFPRVQAHLEAVRKGASRIFRPELFDEAAAGFVRVFGTGSDSAKNFERIWKFAAVQSAITGKNVVDIARDLQSVIETGNLEPLMNIPGFTQFRKQLDEMRLKWQETGAPGGEPERLARTRELLSVLSGASAQQDRFLASAKKMPQELLSSAEMANKMRETLEHLGKIFDKVIVPAMEKLTKLLDYFIEKFGIVDNALQQKPSAAVGIFAPGGPSGGPPRVVRGTRPEAWIDEKGRDLMEWMRSDTARKGRQLDLLREDKYLRMTREQIRDYIDRGGTPTVGVQNNTFNIVAPDTLGAGLEVKKIMGDMFNDARASSPPTEGR